MVTKKQAAPSTRILIRTHGKYYFRADSLKGEKDFTHDVNVGSLDIFREQAFKRTGTDDNGNPTYRTTEFLNVRGILKKRLMPILLQRKHPDFARIKYVVIDEIIIPPGQAVELPVQLMSRPMLAQRIREISAPINVSEYVDIDELRSDVLAFLEDPKTFIQDKPRRDARRAAEADFMSMNDISETLPPMDTPRPEPARPTGIADL